MDSLQITIIVFVLGWIVLYVTSALTKTLWVFNGTMIRGAILGIILVYLGVEAQ
jgi:small neutral amino acid transporter SnatA (MarC family)